MRRPLAIGPQDLLHPHEAVAEAVTLGGDPVEDGSVRVVETVGKTLRRSFDNDWRMRNRCDKHLESDIVLIDRELHRDLPHASSTAEADARFHYLRVPAVPGLTLARKMGGEAGRRKAAIRQTGGKSS